MFEFITTLDKQSPLFKPFVEAHQRDAEDRSKKLKEIQLVEIEKEEGYQVAKQTEREAEVEKSLQEEQKHRVQDALNRQTYEQFKTYAEQQYPGNPEQVLYHHESTSGKLIIKSHRTINDTLYLFSKEY